MLAVARATAPEGVPIRWYETGAEGMPLPDEAFDVVLCQPSLQLMSDRAAALRELRRVLAPGGRALVNLPRPNPLFDILDDALARRAGEEAAGFVCAVFSLNRADAVEEPLRDEHSPHRTAGAHGGRDEDGAGAMRWLRRGGRGRTTVGWRTSRG